MTKTVGRKATYKIAGKDARRSPEQQKPLVHKGKRIVLTHFPHTKAGRPKIVDDMVGAPI